MKKYFLVPVILIAMLSGCGDGGDCCSESNSLSGLGGIADGSENPVAKFDMNWTTVYQGQTTGSLSDVTGDQTEDTTLEEKQVSHINFKFDCDKSYDQDEGNTSITQCAWDFGSNIDKCLDRNTTTVAPIVTLVACKDIIDNNLSILLTVTDDENWTNEANVTIGISEKDGTVSAKVLN